MDTDALPEIPKTDAPVEMPHAMESPGLSQMSNIKVPEIVSSILAENQSVLVPDPEVVPAE